MKRSMLVIFVFSVFAVGLQAQRRFSVKDRVESLKKNLALSDTQTVKVDSILTSASEKMSKLPENREERRTAARQIMNDSNNQILNILTPKQKKEYQKMLDQRRNRMMQRRQNMNDQ